MELEPRGDGCASGRFFVKQDHQGPPGYAHGGIMATALDEAMSLLAHHVGEYPLTAWLSIDLRAPAPVGAFVEVDAEVVSVEGRRLELRSTASNEGVVLAEGDGGLRGGRAARIGAPWSRPRYAGKVDHSGSAWVSNSDAGFLLVAAASPRWTRRAALERGRVAALSRPACASAPPGSSCRSRRPRR